MSVYFKSPPINEVVIATYFKPAVELRSEHIGLFWAQIKSEFPLVRQQPPVGTEIPMGGDVFPMPRYWFTADDGISLIQIQKNAFMFNWRRREDEYPRYHKIKPCFDKYYSLFSEFISAEVPSSEQAIDMCELTYVNAVRSGTTSHVHSTPILVFEIKATEQVGSIPKSEADRWFDRAHTAVMNCFLGITNESIQLEHWEREQAPDE